MIIDVALTILEEREKASAAGRGVPPDGNMRE